MFEQIAAMGARVDAEFGALNCNDAALPEIAGRALAELDVEMSWDPMAIADFQRTSHREPLKGSFSDLPVMIYAGHDVAVEMLVWTVASTAIHEHAFSGAFRVLVGGSVHSRYTFAEHEVVGNDLRFGSVDCLDVERLTVGDVREIHAGAASTHRLFHLDSPSITLVVRSFGSAIALPQWTLRAPCFAHPGIGWTKDGPTTSLRRLLAVTRTIDRRRLESLMCSHVATLDFPRMFGVLDAVASDLSDAEKEHFLEAASANHRDDLVDGLGRLWEVEHRERRLMRFRRNSVDPDLRFFIALLLNATSRAQLMSLVEERYPDEDPAATCASFLARLAQTGSGLQDKLHAIASQTEADAFGGVLRTVVPPSVDDADLAAFFRHAIAADDADPHGEWDRATDAIREVRELKFLFAR